MDNLKVLNGKEKKHIIELLEKQYGFQGPFEYVALMNKKSKIFIANKEIFDLDLKKLRVNSLGMYLGELYNESIRLSIEGSQLIGKHATKNIAILNHEQIQRWMKGEDVEYLETFSGFVLVKYADDFYSCGKTKEGKLLNYVPRARSLKVVNI
jgi:NOL1/NOP2/fmu family ribosome biogenesis protein